MPLVASDVLAAPFFAAAGLLVAAGLTKLRRPDSASRALSAAGLPSSPLVVRILSAWELSVGAFCLVAPIPPAAIALAATYLSFAAFLTYLIVAKLAPASCGCLGQREVPPSALHVSFNLIAAAVAAVVALAGLPGVVTLAAGLPLSGFPLLVGIPLAGYLAYLAVAFLPELLRAASSRERRVLSARTNTIGAGSARRRR